MKHHVLHPPVCKKFSCVLHCYKFSIAKLKHSFIKSCPFDEERGENLYAMQTQKTYTACKVHLTNHISFLPSK